MIGAADLRDDAAGFARGGGGELIRCLLSALRAAAKLPPARRTTSGLSAIANDCAARLTARLARPARAGDDWKLQRVSASTPANQKAGPDQERRRRRVAGPERIGFGNRRCRPVLLLENKKCSPSFARRIS